MLSALLAALTSTLSAILNSTSTLFTMDFYAKIDKRADERKLVCVGKLASLVIIVIAALWAPQIGRFGSLLKYYQEMLSYIAPPVVAAFLMGVFSRRANGRGISAAKAPSATRPPWWATPSATRSRTLRARRLTSLSS